MSLFTIDYREAKAGLRAALTTCEREVATSSDEKAKAAVVKLESEIDAFLFVVRDLDGPQYKWQVVKMFVASGYRADRVLRLVDVISDHGFRLWVRVLAFPFVLVIRGVARLFKLGMGR